MRKILLALCLAQFAFGSLAVAPNRGLESNESGVLVLDESNIYSAIEAHQPILVMFYAPWCMYSKALLPEFDKLSRQIRNLGVQLTLAKIEVDKLEAVKRDFNIDGYPTVLLFLEGINVSALSYEYERRATDIMKWLRDRLDF